MTHIRISSETKQLLDMKKKRRGYNSMDELLKKELKLPVDANKAGEQLEVFLKRVKKGYGL